VIKRSPTRLVLESFEAKGWQWRRHTLLERCMAREEEIGIKFSRLLSISTQSNCCINEVGRWVIGSGSGIYIGKEIYLYRKII